MDLSLQKQQQQQSDSVVVELSRICANFHVHPENRARVASQLSSIIVRIFHEFFSRPKPKQKTSKNTCLHQLTRELLRNSMLFAAIL